MSKHYSKELKENAVRYYKEHQDIGVGRCAVNLVISKSTLSTWRKEFENNKGTVPTRCRGNYESDEKHFEMETEYDIQWEL